MKVSFVLLLLFISFVLADKTTSGIYDQEFWKNVDSELNYPSFDFTLNVEEVTFTAEDYRKPIIIEEGNPIYDFDPLFQVCKQDSTKYSEACSYFQEVLDCAFIVKANPKHPLVYKTSGVCSAYFETIRTLKNPVNFPFYVDFLNIPVHLPKFFRSIEEISSASRTTKVIPAIKKFINLIFNISES